MATFISHSAAETQALGEAWAGQARRGWVLCLTGDLGAGKTQLVKGLARGLGITSRVQSPTFALVNSYFEGRLPLFHLDLYRLDTPDQIAAAGLMEYLSPDGVAVIEWAERLGIVPASMPGVEGARAPNAPSSPTVSHSKTVVIPLAPRGTSGARGLPTGASPLEGASSPLPSPPLEERGEIPTPDPADAGGARFRWVRFETISEEERRIIYEDIGA